MSVRMFIAVCAVTLLTLTTGVPSVTAQCPASVVTSGLRAPTRIIFSTKGNLLVAESGTGNNNGRISMIDPDSGQRRTLIDGLPSALAAPNNDPAGPGGLAMRGRT